MFDQDTLYVSLLWGALGAGLIVYGKKQGKAPELIGGLSLTAITFFVYSPPLLGVIGLVILYGIHAAHRHGY